MPSPTPRTPELPALDLLGGATMGTTWSVNVLAPGRDLHRLHARIEAVLARVVAQMSTWEPDSDLCRFNRAPPGWVALPTELMTVLSCALRIARDSGGAFDPTLGALVDAWGFGPAGAIDATPTEACIDAASRNAGWQRLELDPEGSRALQPGGLAVDLSAIAKGYAVDLVAVELREAGVVAALVEVGGELFGYGRKPDGSSWRILVESDPDRDAAPAEVIHLDGHAVATSGDRWHRHRLDEREYAHTLDPGTGRPLQDAPLAITVVAASAMEADAWATALSVAGRGQALSLAETHDLAARMVWPDGRVHATPRFASHLAA